MRVVEQQEARCRAGIKTQAQASPLPFMQNHASNSNEFALWTNMSPLKVSVVAQDPMRIPSVGPLMGLNEFSLLECSRSRVRTCFECGISTWRGHFPTSTL